MALPLEERDRQEEQDERDEQGDGTCDASVDFVAAESHIRVAVSSTVTPVENGEESVQAEQDSGDEQSEAHEQAQSPSRHRASVTRLGGDLNRTHSAERKRQPPKHRPASPRCALNLPP